MTTYYFIDGFLFEPEHLSYIESTSVQKDKKSNGKTSVGQDTWHEDFMMGEKNARNYTIYILLTIEK